jgi:DNA-binding PadR family transcriptional regulator
VVVSYTLLGLLEESSRHGYDLKRSYDRRFGEVKPIRFGQVYRTLSQLERDGLVEVVQVEAGAGPERKRYSITREGVVDLDTWLGEPEEPRPLLRSVLFTKVVVALLSGRSAARFLDLQRAVHVETMQALRPAGRSDHAGRAPGRLPAVPSRGRPALDRPRGIPPRLSRRGGAR